MLMTLYGCDSTKNPLISLSIRHRDVRRVHSASCFVSYHGHNDDDKQYALRYLFSSRSTQMITFDVHFAFTNNRRRVREILNFVSTRISSLSIKINDSFALASQVAISTKMRLFNVNYLRNFMVVSHNKVANG